MRVNHIVLLLLVMVIKFNLDKKFIKEYIDKFGKAITKCHSLNKIACINNPDILTKLLYTPSTRHVYYNALKCAKEVFGDFDDDVNGGHFVSGLKIMIVILALLF